MENTTVLVKILSGESGEILEYVKNLSAEKVIGVLQVLEFLEQHDSNEIEKIFQTDIDIADFTEKIISTFLDRELTYDFIMALYSTYYDGTTTLDEHIDFTLPENPSDEVKRAFIDKFGDWPEEGC